MAVIGESSHQRGEQARPSFESWAGVVLLIGAALGLLAVALTIGTSGSVAPWLRFAAAASTSAAIVALVLATWGLFSGRPWARPLAIVLLLLIVLFGAIDTVAALVQSSLHIPLLALAALLVLVRWRPPLTWPVPARDRLIVAGLSALYLVPTVAGPALAWAATPGSPFTVSSSAIELSVDLDCGTGEGPPEQIRATLRWTWQQRDLVPGGHDGLRFRWDFLEPKLPGTYYTAVEVPGARFSGGPNWSRSDPQPGDELAVLGPLAQFEGVFGYYFRVIDLVLDVGQQGMRDGSVSVLLEPDGEPPAHATLQASGAYARLDHWTVQSAPTTCEW